MSVQVAVTLNPSRKSSQKTSPWKLSAVRTYARIGPFACFPEPTMRKDHVSSSSEHRHRGCHSWCHDDCGCSNTISLVPRPESHSLRRKNARTAEDPTVRSGVHLENAADRA